MYRVKRHISILEIEYIERDYYFSRKLYYYYYKYWIEMNKFNTFLYLCDIF